MHSCLCTHAQTSSWWSGRRHDKQLRNRRLSVWNTENGFSKVEGHGQTEGDREIEMEMGRELRVKRGWWKKLKTCMCQVSRPSYIKQTQINRGAIAFSERTADRPINEG